MKSQSEMKKEQCKEGSSSKPRTTFAKTGSAAKGKEPDRREEGENRKEKRAKLTFAEGALWTHSHSHIRKDRRGKAKLDHKQRFGHNPVQNTCKIRGLTCFGQRQDHSSQPTQRPFWTKVAKTRERARF